MILNRINDSFPYGDITYTVGAKVFANEESEYHGLYGVITEIRYGEDQETDNDLPDIYCSFIPPILPAERKTSKPDFRTCISVRSILTSWIWTIPLWHQICCTLSMRPFPLRNWISI